MTDKIKSPELPNYILATSGTNSNEIIHRANDLSVKSKIYNNLDTKDLSHVANQLFDRMLNIISGPAQQLNDMSGKESHEMITKEILKTEDKAIRKLLKLEV